MAIARFPQRMKLIVTLILFPPQRKGKGGHQLRCVFTDGGWCRGVRCLRQKEVDKIPEFLLVIFLSKVCFGIQFNRLEVQFLVGFYETSRVTAHHKGTIKDN